MAEPIGSLVVRIGGDATDLLDAFRKASKATTDLNGVVQSAVSQFKALAVALEIREMAHFIASVAEAEDQVGKWSEKIGISVEQLSELKYGAGLANVSLDGLGSGLKNLSKYMVENHVTGTTLEKELFRIADVFQQMEDGEEKATAALKLFGKNGLEMIPLLNQGAAGLRANAEEARKLGLVISTETAKQAAEFNDNMKRLSEVTAALSRELAGPLIKALSDSAAEFIKAKKEGEGFFGAMYSGLQLLLTGTDVDKWNKDFSQAVDRLGEAESKLNEFKALAKDTKSPLDERQVKIWTAEVVKAQAEIKRLQAIKPFIAPDKPEEEKSAKTGGGFDFTSAADAEKLAKQLQEGLEEEIRIQGEAWKATAEFRDKQLAVEKAFLDARNVALIEAFDREQADAIAQGEILQSIDDQSHSMKLDALLKQHDAEYAENERFRLAVEELETNFSEAELEALGGLHSVKEEMEQDHQNRLIEIRGRAIATAAQFTRAGYAQQAKTIFAELANITAGVAQHNRAMFEINKVSGIANAIINAYEGISKTLATYPYPLNIAMAAAHAAAAFAQVNAIRSASFGGGGGAPSLAGGTAATPVTPVSSGAPAGGGGDRRGPDTVIHLHGERFGRKEVRDLLEQINEEIRDGGRLVLA